MCSVFSNPSLYPFFYIFIRLLYPINPVILATLSYLTILIGKKGSITVLVPVLVLVLVLVLADFIVVGVWIREKEKKVDTRRKSKKVGKEGKMM